MKHLCYICRIRYECVWCNSDDSKTIGCMNLPPKVYPRLMHSHFICSKKCLNFMIDNWMLIDQTANIDCTLGDLQRSNERYKKRKLNVDNEYPNKHLKLIADI